MKPRLSVLALLVTLSFAPGLVRAQPTPADPAPLVYGFDDEVVAGDVIGSEGEILEVRQRGTRTSLVEVRVSYLPELVRSVEDL
jgi:hypothetical protein